MFSLEIVEYCQCLMLETDTKPFGEIRKCADPFSGTDSIGDSLNAPDGASEVRKRAKDHVIKKIGTSVCPDVPIFHKISKKASVNTTAWVIHDLFNFNLVIHD